MASSLEQDARLILASAEISAARTLGAFQMVGETMASVGNMVAKIYETKNATALEAWKLQEDQRRWDQNFALEQVKAQQDSELKNLQMAEIQLQIRQAQDNWIRQTIQKDGDRILGQPIAAVAMDGSRDRALGLIRVDELEMKAKGTVPHPVTREAVPIESSAAMQGQIAGIYSGNSAFLQTRLTDPVNPDGMTLEQIRYSARSPTNPNRMEALRLLAANSSPQSFEAFAASAGIEKGSADWTRLQQHIAHPGPMIQQQRLTNAQTAYEMATTDKERLEASRRIDEIKRAQATDWQQAGAIDPNEQRMAVSTAVLGDGVSLEEQFKDVDRGWLGDAIHATGSGLKTAGRFVSGIPKDETQLASWTALGERATQEYLLTGKAEPWERMNFAIGKINELSKKHGGPAVTVHYFAGSMATAGYAPGGVPNMVPGKLDFWNQRLMDTFRIIAPAPNALISPVPTTTLGTSSANPFPTKEAAAAAGLPSGTTVYYLNTNGQLVSAPVQ